MPFAPSSFALSSKPSSMIASIVGNVGVDRHQVLGEIAVDECAEARVDDALLVQRRADAPDHAADQLRARRLGVEMRPPSNTPSMRRSRISPVSASTRTSAKCAP